MNRVKYNNLSPLPLYKTYYGDTSIWDSQKWYAYGNVYPLISPTYLMPFFFYLQGETIFEIKVYKLCEKAGFSISRNNFEEVSRANWKDDFINAGLVQQGDLVFFLPKKVDLFNDGYYYIEFLLEKNIEGVPTPTRYTFISEIFKVQKEINRRMVSLKWRNNVNLFCDGVKIPYTQVNVAGKVYKYFNQVYLDSTIGMPVYEMEEEGENRDGYFYPIKQVSYKKYKFNFYAPEYLCDVLRLVPLSDLIEVSDDEGYILKPTDFNVNFEWLEQGHYAKVECEFTTNTVVKKIGGMGMAEKGKSFNISYDNSFE